MLISVDFWKSMYGNAMDSRALATAPSTVGSSLQVRLPRLGNKAVVGLCEKQSHRCIRFDVTSLFKVPMPILGRKVGRWLLLKWSTHFYFCTNRNLVPRKLKNISKDINTYLPPYIVPA